MIKKVKSVKPVKKIKKVKVVKHEQLEIDGRPYWVPKGPIQCPPCKRIVVLKPNGECPYCHLLLAGPDDIPF